METESQLEPLEQGDKNKKIKPAIIIVIIIVVVLLIGGAYYFYTTRELLYTDSNVFKFFLSAPSCYSGDVDGYPFPITANDLEDIKESMETTATVVKKDQITTVDRGRQYDYYFINDKTVRLDAYPINEKDMISVLTYTKTC